LSFCPLRAMHRIIVGSLSAVAIGQACICPWTSSNRKDCCTDHVGGGGGEGSGDFCGNWFHKKNCSGSTPVCCNSDIGSHCGPVGSSCSPGCILGYKSVGSDCRVIPPASSLAAEAFDVGKAKAIANLASAAGCGPTDGFKSFNCKACQDMGFDVVPGSMRFVTHDDLLMKKANFAYIAQLQPLTNTSLEPSCVIANRGSVNIVNYIQDATFWHHDPELMPDCDGCKVHTGFYHAWADMETDALAALADLGCTPEKKSKVLITGHSLGAAASIVAMFSLKVKGFDVQPSVVFEPPRVGNQAFSEAFANIFEVDFPLFVVTHAMDPVVHLPWTDIPGIQYRHVTAPEVYYFPSNDRDQYIVCSGPDDPDCSNRYALPDTLASGSDHCKNALAPVVNPDDNLNDFCYFPPEMCSGGTSEIIV